MRCLWFWGDFGQPVLFKRISCSFVYVCKFLLSVEFYLIAYIYGLLRWHSSKESTWQCRRHKTWVQFLGWEDPLEKEMATHSSILAWKIPWTKEPGGLQSMGSRRVQHNWACTHTIYLYLLEITLSAWALAFFHCSNITAGLFLYFHLFCLFSGILRERNNLQIYLVNFTMSIWLDSL